MANKYHRKSYKGGKKVVQNIDPIKESFDKSLQEMKKLMNQYKGRPLDIDAAKKSFKIWTKK